MKKFDVGTGRYEKVDKTRVALPLGAAVPETFEQTMQRLVQTEVNRVLGRQKEDIYYDNDDDDDFDVDDGDGFDYPIYEDDEEVGSIEAGKEYLDASKENPSVSSLDTAGVPIPEAPAEAGAS